MGDNSGEKYAEQQAADQKAREGRIRTGTDDVNRTFDDTYDKDYYSNIKKGATDFYEPQIQQQAAKKHSSMLFNMARQGLAGGTRDSNSADRNFGELDAARGKALVSMERNADNVVNQRRNAVEQARAGVLGQLNVSANTDTAMSAARNQIDGATAVPDYNPLGDVFTGVGGGLMQYNNLKNLRSVGETQEDIKTASKSTG